MSATTYYDKAATISVNFKVDKPDLQQLKHFIDCHSIHLLNDTSRIFLVRECDALEARIDKQLSGYNSPKKFRVNFFEIYTISFLYKNIACQIMSEADVHATFPYVADTLIDRIPSNDKN